MAYRVSRNLEASAIDYISSELTTANWTGVTVEKAFSRVYSIALPVICVRILNTTHDKIELGSNKTFRTAQMVIDIFGSDDGNRLDLKDFLVDILKLGFPYLEYTIVNGAISTKPANGRVTVKTPIREMAVDYDIDRSKLDIHDRYRHRIILEVTRNSIE